MCPKLVSDWKCFISSGVSVPAKVIQLGDEGWWVGAADASGDTPGSGGCSCCAEGFPLPRVLWWHPGSPGLHSREQ